MASIITAGNATNGLAMSSDGTGTLNIKTGTGTGTNAITIDASQAVTIPQTLAVTGAQTIGGNLTVTGTVSATGGVTGSITSGTAVSASGTSVNFTSIPSSVKRITVMFSGVKSSGGSDHLLQLGTSGGVTTSGYLGASTRVSSATPATANYTTGFGTNVGGGTNTNVFHGAYTFSYIGSNIWVCSALLGLSNSATTVNSSGGITLGGTLDRVRITTVNGTDTFTAGTINILYE